MSTYYKKVFYATKLYFRCYKKISFTAKFGFTFNKIFSSATKLVFLYSKKVSCATKFDFTCYKSNFFCYKICLSLIQKDFFCFEIWFYLSSLHLKYSARFLLWTINSVTVIDPKDSSITSPPSIPPRPLAMQKWESMNSGQAKNGRRNVVRNRTCSL